MLACGGEAKPSMLHLSVASSSSLNLACFLYRASDNSRVQPLQPPVQAHGKVGFPLELVERA